MTSSRNEADAPIESPLRVTVERRGSLAKIRKIVAELAGNRCSFPDCKQDLLLDGTIFLGEVAAIESLSPHGPRYESESPPRTRDGLENYVLLCPSHHRLIDREPEKYTAAWLRDARKKHLDRVRKALTEGVPTVKPKLEPLVELSLEEAISIWRSSKEEAAEEFWHQLFERCPSVIAQIFPRHMFQLGSKCYVGGKSIHNRSGNLVDFVYANKQTNNVVIVEIKTPQTKLLGKKYRQNAYALSEDLSGSIVQALSYKDSLTKNYYSLMDGDDDFKVFSPKCVVIAGSAGLELDSSTKLKSFELFRSELPGVELLTYDELFDKIEGILDIVN